MPVKFEGVGTIAMCGLFFQVLWKVDDDNGIKGAFLQQMSTQSSDTQEEFCHGVMRVGTRTRVNFSMLCNRLHTTSRYEQGCSAVTLIQIPQPMQSSSEIQAVLELGVTSMHSFPAQQHRLSAC